MSSKVVSIIILICMASICCCCNPTMLVRQTPQTAQYMGIQPGFCPTTVIGSCRQCLDNYQCPGNQICCPVSGLYCCVAMPAKSVKDRLFPQVYPQYGP